MSIYPIVSHNKQVEERAGIKGSSPGINPKVSNVRLVHLIKRGPNMEVKTLNK